MYNALYETYYRTEPADKYLIQMQSQMTAAGVNLLEVCGTKKTSHKYVYKNKTPRYKRNRYIKIDQS